MPSLISGFVSCLYGIPYRISVCFSLYLQDFLSQILISFFWYLIVFYWDKNNYSAASLSSWTGLQGEHPFHNYTIRSKYRKHSPARKLLQYDCLLKKGRPSTEEEISGCEESDGEENCKENGVVTTVEDENQNPVCNLSTGNQAGNYNGKLSHSKELYPVLPILARWLHETDARDKLSSAHFRRIFHCHCGKLEKLFSMNYVEVSICGESFMLHQVILFDLSFCSVHSF